MDTAAEVDATAPRPIEATAELVKQLRDALLKAGFHHASGYGELASEDGTTWVGTSYVHDEFTVHAWRRPNGHGEIGEKKSAFRIHPRTEPADVEVIAKRLARWARKPRKGATWPPLGME